MRYREFLKALRRTRSVSQRTKVFAKLWVLVGTSLMPCDYNSNEEILIYTCNWLNPLTWLIVLITGLIVFILNGFEGLTELHEELVKLTKGLKVRVSKTIYYD